MNSATISADIISYTSLIEQEKRVIEKNIEKLLSLLTKKYKDQYFFGRLIKGDYIECAMYAPEYSLRIALLLKTFIKSIKFDTFESLKTRSKYFLEHGIRLAVAVAPLTSLEPKNGVMDGEAIYISGRAIKNFTTYDKQKIVIKNTMLFRSKNDQLQEQIDVLFSLLDFILANASAKQCEVIYYKLLDYSEKEIAKILKKSQSTISQHSTAGGWQQIERTVNYFEKVIKKWN